MKIFSPNNVCLILYDSAKKQLSRATLSAKMEIIVQNDNYVTYNDDSHSTWSLMCCNSQDCSNIIKEIQNHDVIVRFDNKSSTTPPMIPAKPSSIVHKKDTSATSVEKSDHESDIDSSLCKKKKASLISRMAMMGQSILPSLSTIDNTSDSSDNTDCRNQINKNVRHKTIKSSIKKTNHQKSNDATNAITEDINPALHSSNPDIIPLYTSINGQLVPVTHTNITTMPFNNTERADNIQQVLLSEQRINNTELRMNLNRVSDKVDQILDKVKLCEIENIKSRQNCSNDIYMKLLTEYENKISHQSNKITFLENQLTSLKTNPDDKIIIKQLPDYMELNEKIKYLEMTNREKDTDIDKLRNELFTSKNKNSLEEQKLNEQAMLQKIEVLEKELVDKCKIIELNNDSVLKVNTLEQENECLKSQLSEATKEHDALVKECEYLRDTNSKVINELDQMKLKNKDNKINFNKTVKEVMNTTYHTLSANFQSGESYSGDDIKGIIATIIKKITMKHLSEDLKQ